MRVADYLLAAGGPASKIDELRVVARAYARRYAGKVTLDLHTIHGAPPCLYEVTGRFRGRSLKFRIFDGGCIVEGETPRVANTAISVNGKGIRATVPVPQVGSGGAPRLFRDDSITDREARAALAAPQASQALHALGLARGELLAINSHPHFGYSKRPTFSFVHRAKGGPDFAGLGARLDILAKLLPWRVKRAAALEGPVFSANAYRIRIGARVSSGNGDAPHTFGGTLDHDLKCRNCKAPIQRLLTIDTRARGLQLPSLGRREFRIVYCLSCMSFPGLLYVDYSKPKLRIIRQDKQARVHEDLPYPARKVTLTQLRPATRSSSKIGGTPNWIQNPEIPDCARCRNPMAFLAQIRSLPDLSFVDEGMLYTFVCTACKVSAGLIQSH